MAVISALTSSSDSPLYRTLLFFVPRHVKEVRLSWVPGHTDIRGNEQADHLANLAVTAPIQFGIPNLALFASARLRRYWHLDATRSDSLLSFEEFQHLKFGWNVHFCGSRQCEVTFTELRCRVPRLNFYLFRSELSPTELCVRCQVPETIEHFFLDCRRFSTARQLFLKEPIERLGLTLSITLILSIGASKLGFARRDIYNCIQNFLSASGRLNC